MKLAVAEFFIVPWFIEKTNLLRGDCQLTYKSEVLDFN